MHVHIRRPHRFLVLLLAALGFILVAPTDPPPAAAQVPDSGIDVNTLPSEQALRSWQVRDLQPAAESTLADFDVLVWDFAEINGVVYVGGRFQTVRRSAGSVEHDQPFLAAFDMSSGDWVQSFRPVLDDGVYALEVTADGRLLVGGEFSSVNGVPGTAGIAALDPVTGAPDPGWVTSVSRDAGDHIVTEIVVASDAIYIGGRFNRVHKADGTQGRKYGLARLDPVSGATDWDFEVPVSGGRVMAMALSPDENELYVGGFFSSIGFEPTTRWLAMVRTGTGEVVPMADPLPQDRSAWWAFDLAVSDSLVWVAVERHRMFAYDRDTLEVTADYLTDGYGGDPQAVHYHDGVVWAGGHFHGWERDQRTGAWYRQVNWVTAYNAETASPVEDWIARMGATDGIWALHVDAEGKLWAGGDPTSSGTVPVSGFAVFPNRSADTEQNLARNRPTTQSSTAPTGIIWTHRADGAGMASPERRCPGTAVGQPSQAVDGKTAGGPWECSMSSTAAQLQPWWQVDLGQVGEVDAVRIWNLWGTPVADELADVWIAVSENAGAINSTDPVALAANPAVTLTQIPGQLDYFEEVPVGALGRYVRVFMNADQPTQLRLPEVEVLDINGISPAAVVGQSSLVPQGATWRYFDTGSAPTGDWKSVGFNDSGWDSGPAIVGFGDADVATETQKEVLTTYLRHGFNVTNPAAVNGLQLEVLADDGAVVYLNGTELYRLRMPNGPVSNSTYASESVWGVAERSWATVQVPADALVAGDNVLAVEVHNDWRRGPDIAFDAVLSTTDQQVGPVAQDQLLVSFEDTWRYNDTGTADAAWRQPAYNDSQWSSGTGQFGYGDGDEATVISEGPVPNRHLAYYFRSSFDVADPGDVSELMISLIRDDGAVVYINGTEVLRSNMGAGAITGSTLALDYAWGSGERDPHVSTVSADMLVAGSNTIAVEVHSADRGSRDLSFDLELIGVAQ